MIIIQIFYHILYIIYINERRSILQQLLTNVTEYGIKDIAKILPIGEQQIRRYIGTGVTQTMSNRTAVAFVQKLEGDALDTELAAIEEEKKSRSVLNLSDIYPNDGEDDEEDFDKNNKNDKNSDE